MTTATPPPPARTISRQELADEIARRQGQQGREDPQDPFRLVMALNEFAYRAKHIPGSLFFPTAAQMFDQLGKQDDIVVYCSNVDCHASLAVYRALLDHGYTNVRHYPGGLFDWESAGLPLEGDWVAPK
jgi:rhodanese-related sulfurtransferase